MDRQYAIDLQTLTKTVDSFAESFGDYLETELEYFDYLRKRPRFFLGKKYVRNRIVIGKVPVPEEQVKLEAPLPRFRRNQPQKQPVNVPVKQPVKQAEAQEQVAEPVQTPVNVPLQFSGKPAEKPKIATVPTVKPRAVPVEPAGPPKIKPTQPIIPKPKPVTAGNKIVPLKRSVTPAKSLQLRSGLPTGNKRGLLGLVGGLAFGEIERQNAEKEAKELLELKATNKQEYRRRLNELRLAAKTERLINPILELTGTPTIPKAYILKSIGELKADEIPASILGTDLKPDLNPDGSPIEDSQINGASLKELEKRNAEIDRIYGVTLNAEGGVPQGPSRALIGERASPKGNELVATASQIPGITEAIHKEIGSIMVGATFSVAYAIPHGRSSSAVLNDINQLKRTFGMDKVAKPDGIGRAAGSMEVFNVEGFQQKLLASSKSIIRKPGSRGGRVGATNEQEEQQPVQLSPIEILGDVKVDASGEPGYDFTPKGGNNLAIFPGKVIEWGYQYNGGRGYGNFVVIRSADPQTPGQEFDALYAHFPNSEVNKYVRVGDTVQRGQVLGRMGNLSDPPSEIGSITGEHTSLDFLEPGTNTPYRRWRSLQPLIKGGPNTGQPPQGQGGDGLAEFLGPSNTYYQELLLNSGLIPEEEKDGLRQYWAEEAEKGNYNFPMMLSKYLLAATDELRFKTDLMFKGLGEGIDFSADFTGSGPSNPKTLAGRIFKGRKLADFADQQISKLFLNKWKPDIFKKLAGANYAGQYFTPDLATAIKYGGKNGTVIVLPRAQGARGLKNFFGNRISRGFDFTKGIEQFVRTGDVQRLTRQASASGMKTVYNMANAADVEALTKLASNSMKTNKFLAKFGRAIPFLGIAAAAYDVQDRVRKGDFAGAALGAISAVPGPIGWVGLGAQVAYDMGKTQKPAKIRPVDRRQQQNLKRSGLNRSVVVPVPVQGPSKTVPVPVRRRNVRGGGSIVISPFGKGSTKK
jgi:hypothetical protein